MSTTATPPPASAPSTGAAAPSSPVISLESVMAAPAASASPSTPAPDAPSRASTTKTSAPATEPTTPYSADDLDSLAADSSIEGIAALLMRGGPAQTLDDDPTLATPTDAPLAPRDDDDPTRPEAAAAAEALDATADDDDATDAGDDEKEDGANPAEAELDEEAEPVAEEEAGETLPPAFQKRIDKLTAIKERFKTERDEARQVIDELRSQLADQPALAPVVLPVTPEDPLADLTTEKDVQQRLTMARQVIAWADAHPDGGEIADDQGNTHYFTPQQVAERRLKAQKLAEIDVPKRLAYLRDQRAAEQIAQTVYPDLFQPGSFMAQQADQFISAIPGITRHPNYALFVGDWVVGAAARAGHYRLVPVTASGPAAPSPAPAAAATAPAHRAPASTAPATPAAPATSVSSTTTTPPRRPRASTTSAQIDAYLAKGADSIDDLAAMLMSRAA